MNLRLVCASVFLFILFPLSAARAGTLTYPGAAPCDTTLQACIDGANSGDTIEIATNNRIHETFVQIRKSLTLTAAQGFTPLFGNPSPMGLTTTDQLLVFPDAMGTTLNVTLSKIHFDGGRVQAEFDSGTGHHFEMLDCEVSYDVTFVDRGLWLVLNAPTTFLVQGNTFKTSSEGIEVFNTNTGAGTISGTIQRNIISTLNTAHNVAGIALDVEGSTLTVDLFSNLIFGLDAQAGAINVQTRGTGNLNLNITNNTIDNITNPLFVDGSNAVLVNRQDTSVININFFNNIISNIVKFGFNFQSGFPDANLTLVNGSNDFFNINTETNDSDFTPDASNLGLDPLYQNAAGADYRLKASSQLVDAGNDNPPGGLPTVDLANLPRISGNKVDIGAFELAVCGDGIVAGEACDDGNTTGGDGCSATCAIESGFSCTGSPSVCTPNCGDGIVAGSEACDDGNTTGGDGCSNTCTVESGFTCTGAPSVCVKSSSGGGSGGGGCALASGSESSFAGWALLSTLAGLMLWRRKKSSLDSPV